MKKAIRKWIDEIEPKDVREYIQQLEAENKELRGHLKEAIILINDTRNGCYKPDSFTTQPWEKVLKEVVI